MSEKETVTIGGITCRAPTLPEFHRAIDDLEKSKFSAMRKLVATTRVEPSSDEVREILDRKPGYVLRLGNALFELAGIVEDEVEGN